jgi:hypothetical protein
MDLAFVYHSGCSSVRDRENGVKWLEPLGVKVLLVLRESTRTSSQGAKKGFQSYGSPPGHLWRVLRRVSSLTGIRPDIFAGC